MKMPFESVVFTSLYITQSTLLKTRSYAANDPINWDNSFVTVTIARAVGADGKDNYDALFEISYTPGTVEECTQESLISLMDSWEDCGPATKLRMKLFYQSNVSKKH